MRRWSVVGLVLMLSGCSGNGGGGWFSPQGERWTILCLELRGPGCRESADRVADVLRKTSGIDRQEVQVFATSDSADIYYGTYYRRLDPLTGRRSIPKKMAADLTLLKELADDQGRHFFLHARSVPAPAPDVGRPEWDLRNAEGVYTLQVAVYMNDQKMHQRKRAAVEKVRQLRDKGFEAYYYHGHSRSMVTVGTFGPDALRDAHGQVRHVDIGGEQRQIAQRYSDEVVALQRQEECAYNLTNDDIWYNKDDTGKLYPVESMLVRIPTDEDWP